MSTSTETEVKIACPGSARDAWGKIEGLGYLRESERTLEADQLYDRAEDTLRASDRILRLRRESNSAGSTWTLTYKGPAERGIYKSREELETQAANGEMLSLILDRLGFTPWFRYEKYRTKFRKAGEPGIVTVDDTPLGVFLELEGPTEWIDKTAGILGFGSADFVILSYSALWRQYREAHSNAPEDMIFPEETGAP